jgi:hypothetical protein
MLNANQLSVEHRFFEPSRPDPADWSLLTIEQAADDFHRLKLAFAWIYGAPWVSTGGSKGGMTALFYRRFHPDDVTATVAYVAPISLSGNDPRYPPFLATAGGDPACSQALVDWQRDTLNQRAAIATLIDADAAAMGWTFSILGRDRAFEHAVIEAPFFMWQYGNAVLCDFIPGAGATADEDYQFLSLVSSLENFNDAFVVAYGPYFYQAAVELGWPQPAEDAIADLLLYPGTDIPETYSSVPPPPHDPAVMADFVDWVQSDGTRLLLVYGENDPWSAAMLELGGATDSYRFIAPDGNHGSGIADLDAADRAAAVQALETWTNTDVPDTWLTSPPPPAPFSPGEPRPPL